MIIDNQEWFESLLEECRAIVTEYGFTSRWAKVEGYHSLGQRILEENNNFERSKIYGQQVIKRLSKEINLSERTLQYAVQFAQKFPALDSLPAGKNVTWSKIIKEYLPEHPQAASPQKVHTCPQCGSLIQCSRGKPVESPDN